MLRTARGWLGVQIRPFRIGAGVPRSPVPPRQSSSSPDIISIMADSQIPHLKALLGGRRGGLSRGRGRGRGRGGFGASHGEHEAIVDDAVRGTDQDAAGSRVSCVELGYLDDPYAKLFATRPSTRRLPLLNRGKAKIHPNNGSANAMLQAVTSAPLPSTCSSTDSSPPPPPLPNR